jgi:hypothetical protein
MFGQESTMGSTKPVEAQGGQSQLVRVEVTGAYLDPNFLIPR